MFVAWAISHLLATYAHLVLDSLFACDLLLIYMYSGCKELKIVKLLLVYP
jgi:hypothetical protein